MEYLIKSSALIIVFYLCYTLLLKRDTFFQSNRWFLLSGLLISFCLPLIVIPIYITKEISAEFTSIGATTIFENTKTEIAFNWFNIFIFIYLAGIIYLSLRFISQLLSLAFKLSKGSSKKQDGFIFIETHEAIAPFSFFNYIVFNPSDFNNQELEHIINHEKVHANQNHSIDILISHIASIICWFNPIVWQYKKDLQQNLEFIADHEALSSSNCRKTYQYVLLKTSVPNYQMALTNNFYNSLIKKRIVMLHKNKSKKRNQIKMILILPILAVFLMSFSTEEIITYKTIEPNLTETFAETISEITPTEKHEEPNITSTNKTKNTFEANPKKVIKKEDIKGDIETIIISKDMSDSSLDAITERLKEKGITLKFKGVKRNSKNEIIAIKITAKTKTSDASISQTDDDAIDPIVIKIEDGSVSIGNGHDSGHRDYIFESHDGKTKVVKATGSNVFVHTDGDAHEEHEVIEEDDKIIIKSGGTIKEIKKKGKGKSLWITSDDENDEHQILEIKEKGNGETIIIKKGEDGKLIKSSSKNLWIVDEDDDDKNKKPIILEIKENDNNLFSSKANRSDKPLFVLNGRIIGKGEISDLEPNNIESINVLKGKAAIIKYGEKGKDGVIEIITKGN